jgi:peptidoglycan/LPS O-acetylase OafA/YrhL
VKHYDHVLDGLRGTAALCVVMAVLMAGARMRLAGELSYPVHIVHYRFIDVFAHWLWRTHPSTPALAVVACALSRIALEGEAEPVRSHPRVTV